MSSAPPIPDKAGPEAELAAIPPERRWHAQPFPAPIVAAVIRRAGSDGDEFLLIRRNKPPYAGQWALVGGKWDFGETLAAAVTREVAEEAGLTTELVALRAVVSERVLPRDAGDRAAHFVIFVCDLRVLNGEAATHAEGDVAWFTAETIASLAERGAIIASDHEMLRAYAASPVSVPRAEALMQLPATLLSFDAAGRG